MLAQRLHELQHAGLAEHVLKHHAVRAQKQITLARNHFLFLGIIEMAEQHFVGQRQRSVQAAADHFQIARHGLIDLGDHLRRGFNSNHAILPRIDAR